MEEVIADHTYTAEAEVELSIDKGKKKNKIINPFTFFSIGDIIQVLDKNETSGWWDGRIKKNGIRGCKKKGRISLRFLLKENLQDFFHPIMFHLIKLLIRVNKKKFKMSI